MFDELEWIAGRGVAQRQTQDVGSSLAKNAIGNDLDVVVLENLFETPVRKSTLMKNALTM